MKVTIQLKIEDDDIVTVDEVSSIERLSFSEETVGLQLKEAKNITFGIQKIMIQRQIHSFVNSQRNCQDCGKKLTIKGYSTLTYRTLFGKFHLKSPRLNHCRCSSEKGSFSPVVKVLKSRVSPEMAYIESKWASLMSYGMTAGLVEEVLPVKIAHSSVYDKSREISERLESELDKEQYVYIDGCPNEWANLPRQDEPLTVGIDGGYIHAREGDNRKAGWFEAIVGKCLQEGHQTRRFGFVNGDDKGKRRLYEMLKHQNMQLNQPITFLSDGGDNVRDLQQFLSPEAEYLLDWFHVTMRITVLRNMAKSIHIEDCNPKEDYERIKWSLWNGNVYHALKILEDLNFDLDGAAYENSGKKIEKLRKTSEQFQGYIEANASFIPCYAERYRYGEYISTGFVESTVNELITKRMVKRQQMRWTRKGAHLLLQLRIKTLNNELKDEFIKWYPEMSKDESSEVQMAS